MKQAEKILSIFEMYPIEHIPLITMEELMKDMKDVKSFFKYEFYSGSSEKQKFILYCTELEKNRFLPFNLY
jgi:hypothetical protein